MRKLFDLRLLPVWAQYAVAIAVAALVMFLAWRVGSNRPEPFWLGPVMAVWIWLGPALIGFFVVKWLLKKIGR